LHSLLTANVNRDAERSFKQILDLLVTAGANLEAKDYNGDTPLLSSLTGRSYSREDLSVVEMLLSRGTDPFATDSKGNTLLHKTCQSSPDTLIARKLLELHVTPSRPRSNDGATAMHCAVDNIYCAGGMIRLLASFGADVDVPDANGDTPLMHACKANSGKYHEAIDALLELGANVNVQNSLGQICLHLFQLRTQPYDQNERQLRSIIDAGADLELYDREGRTVLLQSIEKGNEETVAGLLKLQIRHLLLEPFAKVPFTLHAMRAIP
jgi:ankyrin repeat protein